MALVKYGGGIIQMSGSIAGNTHARNRYGNYIRAKTKPVNPRTQLQTDVREAIQQLTTRWSQTVTDVQRVAWNLYANSVNMKNKLGEVIKLSGFNHYIRSNAIFQRLDLPVVDDGPVIFELPEADSTFAVSASETTQNITATFDNTLAWAIEDGSLLCMFQGTPQNAQRNFFAGPWRFWTAVQGVDPDGPVTPRVAPAVFAITELQRMWVYARIIRADGRMSEVFRADTFCVA